MKQSIARLSPVFNTNRVVSEYTEAYYLPNARRAEALMSEGGAGAGALAAWKARVAAGWEDVRVTRVLDRPPAEIPVDTEFRVAAEVELGTLTPDDVAVQLCLGRVGPRGDVRWDQSLPMQPVGEGRPRRFQVAAACGPDSGPHAYTVRVVPSHPETGPMTVRGLVTWADDAS
jgi:starch phosphorylase